MRQPGTRIHATHLTFLGFPFAYLLPDTSSRASTAVLRYASCWSQRCDWRSATSWRCRVKAERRLRCHVTIIGSMWIRRSHEVSYSSWWHSELQSVHGYVACISLWLLRSSESESLKLLRQNIVMGVLPSCRWVSY